MSCVLARFWNPKIHHNFDKSIPQSAIQKPTGDFVQGNGYKLQFKHNTQPATILA